MLKTYLVEDSPVIRSGLIALLEELSPVQIVGVADNEAEAVAWLCDKNHIVDLVIIDIFLKSGSGLGVLRRAAALNLDAKMVVLTNYATADMRQRSLALGAAHLFDKSIDIDALVKYCNSLAGDLDGTTLTPGPEPETEPSSLS